MLITPKTAGINGYMRTGEVRIPLPSSLEGMFLVGTVILSKQPAFLLIQFRAVWLSGQQEVSDRRWAIPGLARKSSYMSLSLSLFLLFLCKNYCSNPAPKTISQGGMGQREGKERLCAKHSTVTPPGLFSVFFHVLHETILAPLSSGSWLDGANGQGPQEAKGRKWREVRVSAPPAPFLPDQEQGSGHVLLPMKLMSSSTAIAPKALWELSTCPSLPSASHRFGSLNLAHPTHKSH